MAVFPGLISVICDSFLLAMPTLALRKKAEEEGDDEEPK
jgi:hypothetical protein